MQRTQRASKAKETLGIIESGHYTKDGRQVSISDKLADSLKASIYYKEEDFDSILPKTAAEAAAGTFETIIRVENCSVLAGAEDLIRKGGRIGCLNFASARNPGGGFLNGALAQEESLAMSSTLYAAQSANFGFYEYNRGRHTLLYSDRMIYATDAVVFRDEKGEFLETPYQIDILTSPAVNVGAIRNTQPEELAYVESVMLERMDKVLALFLHHGATRILLGAWGCGVFRNDPAQMASWFASYLAPGGKYARCFEEVLFAVYDRSENSQNVRPFQDAFSIQTV
jgi:uncharacterized protein (TIGR02452 family)